ncbi:DUF2339 domain-containing protein [Labilibaculum euxinus]|uniref:DUF2339 domain-containing protein n=1 Tax=Labilibaculum euxinus TaxID=2686357 RepID=A0A7M4D8M1_9BACT|nr:DUF2339 domain-containing protein [Labilibaculum euxinus]MUP39000.1 DUF2339 domain-containing protein [Labilibaculum euxinus]MVB08205.1 DUF2339 domain-containing protein [Labilibaculum euxinus]
MSDNKDKINQLFEIQEKLHKKQEALSNEISELRHEIIRLKNSETKPLADKEETQILNKNLLDDLKNIASPADQEKPKIETAKTIVTPPVTNQPPKSKSDLEKFIGENLINKIGIAITIIGVAIGAKYSIDNDLISPLTRIILAYLTGIGLLGFGIKLKAKYENYSAVLVSGAIAILYFITYMAYSLYDLFPQAFAFILMLIFTVFTVVAAINYNKQVIAHIGLVGAYAVPFLLSDGSGKVAVLFTYMTIINIGILFIAFKKYWKALHYSSFVLTWLIFYSWFLGKYETSEHFVLGSSFLIVFFTIFYLLFLAYKLVRKEKFNTGNSLLIVSNSLIFFGLGYSILSLHETGQHLLGLFTLINAVIHSIVSVIIYKQKLADKNVFYLISGLVLIFITIAFPIQLDGNWVTLLWVSEAALLFWIGRTKKVSIYEAMSYPLMILAFCSILQDWTTMYNTYLVDDPETKITLFLNVNFLSSLLFIFSFGFINRLNSNIKYPTLLGSWLKVTKLLSYAIPVILVFTLYYSIRLEIGNYWNQLINESALSIQATGEEYASYYNNYDLKEFKTIWIINYSLLFFSILSFVNIRKFKNKNLAYAGIGLTTISLVVFLTQGLYSLSELRESYLTQSLSEYYHRGTFNIIIRYISLAFAAIALTSIFLHVKKELNTKRFRIAFEYLLSTSILWIFSSELLNWMDISGSTQSYKLGLSILWGSYSLLLIAYGIWKNKKHLRIGAIGLFALTLVKLFFYDISQLSTIAKTIAFVLLGILLLIISFLYNKYKSNMTEEEI